MLKKSIIVIFINKITFPVRKFFQLVDWSRVIWKDEDCDWEFILYILQHKMRRVRFNITKLNGSENVEEMIKEIKECEDAIERILDHNYCEEEFNSINDEVEKQFKEDSGDLVTKISEWPGGLEERFDNLYKQRKNCESKDLEFLFSTMRHMRKWFV